MQQHLHVQSPRGPNSCWLSSDGCGSRCGSWTGRWHPRTKAPAYMHVQQLSNLTPFMRQSSSTPAKRRLRRHHGRCTTSATAQLQESHLSILLQCPAAAHLHVPRLHGQVGCCQRHSPWVPQPCRRVAGQVVDQHDGVVAFQHPVAPALQGTTDVVRASRQQAAMRFRDGGSHTYGATCIKRSRHADEQAVHLQLVLLVCVCIVAVERLPVANLRC